MSDRQNLPRPAPEVTEDGIPSIEEIPEDVLLTGDPVEGEMAPLDRPQAVKDWGTTASEQLAPAWRTPSAPRRPPCRSSTSPRA
jgi:hypothetical protein